MTAKEIREERKSRELTQQQFSNIVGFPLRTIQKWEGSERNMSKWSKRDVLEKLSNYDARLQGTLLTLSLCEAKDE
jgi:DNA-binding transcriptional regulator YiaG